MNGEKIRSFTDLKVWQQGHGLAIFVYNLTKKFPKQEIYCLVSQMRRAAISITSNIAEGFGRRGYKEKIQFYYLAQGSLIELKNQILLAKDLGYVDGKDFQLIVEKANNTHKLLQGLITASKKFLNHNS
ncbi:four helix bundle protein [Patescibacteria group bacterium]|nr:four helix bundle protein [Patescibacteria group bacterium]MBU1934153.1 four helix bundle protein [Patescibacteria group bacterium]MBU2007531.1 four helix bundle protein [Patescibacteria group bacterium]MBU2233962.1 four helix bundle protein [Patescibacteria group bacterium]MBU2264430.1 four helix bundle protein [Patescibacteria group bacterium]